MVDEETSHGVGADSEKMSAALPARAFLIGELEVRLVHQGGGLQGMTGFLLGEESAGDESKLIIDKGEELF